MNMRELMPWGLGRGLSGRRDEDYPFLALQREMNRMFDDFWRGVEVPPSFARAQSAIVPRIDVAETDKEIKVTAELPGIDEKDVEVTLDNNVLTIKGEKKEEKEEKDKNYHLVERSYGAFQRSIPIDADVQGEKVDASFAKGVLTVVLPKSPAEQRKAKKIAVKSA